MKRTASKLRTANLLGALAGEIADRLARRLRAHANQTTDSAAAALHLISLYEGASNAALSQALQLSHPATVRLVDKLEAAGLVESRPGENDRRAVALHLTPAGRERAREVVRDRCRLLCEIVDALSPAQQAQLDEVAETLLRALTPGAREAAHICRLCDETVCPGERCPVHQVAVATTGGAS